MGTKRDNNVIQNYQERQSYCRNHELNFPGEFVPLPSSLNTCLNLTSIKTLKSLVKCKQRENQKKVLLSTKQHEQNSKEETRPNPYGNQQGEVGKNEDLS